MAFKMKKKNTTEDKKGKDKIVKLLMMIYNIFNLVFAANSI